MSPRRIVAHLSLSIAFACAASAAQAQTRIYFARGATRATARGYLRGARDEALFVLRAKAGQHMRVEIRGRGATRGIVIFPSGQQDGGPGGVVFDGILPETGDCRIRVTESSMANDWRGNFTVTIDIVSEGAPVTESRGLARYVGRYPSELFRSESELKQHLRKLLATNYEVFFNRLQTEMPIENHDGVLIVQGCMAHQCTIEVAILAIDLNSDKLHVAIKASQFRNTFKLWNEGGSRVPDALRQAMQEASP